MAIPLSINNVVHLYLYGTIDEPVDVEKALRSSEQSPVVSTTVDVASYMASVGRFSSPFQTKVVQDFFGGNLDLSKYADSDGNIDVTLEQLITDKLAKNMYQVSISQYSTGMGESDYVYRAFIWGSTSFRLGGSTHFVVQGQESYIKGASMLPYDTDFDFESSSSIAKVANDLYLKDLVDPYGIGRKVNLEFTAQDKDTWQQSQANNILHAADDNRGIADYIQSDLPYTVLTGGVYSGILQTASLLNEIHHAAPYIKDGMNVVYGSNSPDESADFAGSAWSFDATKGSFLVGGEGDDIIQGGSHNDRLYGGLGKG